MPLIDLSQMHWLLPQNYVSLWVFACYNKNNNVLFFKYTIKNLNPGFLYKIVVCAYIDENNLTEAGEIRSKTGEKCL